MPRLPIEKITTDAELQPRVALDTWVASDYCEAIRGGAEFPPLVVFWDGTAYWLADGFHRHYAYSLLGAGQVPVDVRNGTRRDALLYSCGANATHGLRRSNGDKRRAVEKLLADSAWQRWSSNHVAKLCGVSPPFVEKLRQESSRNGHQKAVLCRRGDTIYSQALRRGTAVRKPTARKPSNDSGDGGGHPNEDNEDAETTRLQQQNIGRALEIIAGIAQHCDAKTFKISKRMRTHLAAARAWLIDLPE